MIGNSPYIKCSDAHKQFYLPESFNRIILSILFHSANEQLHNFTWFHTTKSVEVCFKFAKLFYTDL